ncbi:MAG TPA: hypothetical protein VG826_22380 [Pirellulales bacterium]|nr:hypothetical protein [Pirellulales bacterium]
MSSVPTTGVCILSIDVRVGDGRVETSDLFLADLCRQLAAAQLPATWSFSGPPADALRLAIDEHRGCELALLAEASWAAEGASRSRFCQGLADGLAAIGSVGLTPATLSLPNGRLASHDDVLVRHGVRAVRVAAGGSRQEPRVQRWWRRKETTLRAISPIRWGLWEVPVNVDLSVAGLAGATRMVDRTARHAGVVVVAADVTTLDREAKRLPRLVDHLKRRSEEKLLRIETIAASVARQQVPRQTPARSILRPLAA